MMDISSEWTLLKKLKKRIEDASLPAPVDLLQGIGDDCAVFAIDNDRCGIITTDISIENVHFRRDFSSPEDIGFKAMTANISDIAAMSGTPRFAFISLGIPQHMSENYIESIYSGMLEAAFNGVPYISGGDLSRSEKLVLSITLYGEALKSHITYRSGARPGDHIYCTGTLGGSYAGLNVLTQNISSSNFSRLIQQHLRPVHRFALISDIHEYYRPSSMIDISDGLLSDMRHICEASGTGFQINTASLPLHPDLNLYSSQTGKDPIAYALKSGEEYELLFTSALDVKDFPQKIKHGVDISKIGVITDSDYVLSDNGLLKKIEIKGYNHFT